MVHDANENALVLSSHVECEDCHNPHASNNLTASAPDVKGYNAGTKGINSNGSAVNPVQFAYEICYRCHADSPNKSPSPTTRKIEQNNVRLEFDLSNPSYHPIEGVGKNSTIPSLISPWTTTSIMYCTDCHASDGVSSPAGPHGSIYPSILKFNYSKIDNTMESANSYSLCYSCHSRSSILADVSFTEHQKHIVGEKTPCNVCHDPHGISSTQGNSTNNSNLINFQLGIVTPSSNGILRFEDQGNLKGRCYLTCHGKNHNPLSY
jgi:ribosomal protein L40E